MSLVCLCTPYLQHCVAYLLWFGSWLALSLMSQTALYFVQTSRVKFLILPGDPHST